MSSDERGGGAGWAPFRRRKVARRLADLARREGGEPPPGLLRRLNEDLPEHWAAPAAAPLRRPDAGRRQGLRWAVAASVATAMTAALLAPWIRERVQHDGSTLSAAVERPAGRRSLAAPPSPANQAQPARDAPAAGVAPDADIGRGAAPSQDKLAKTAAARREAATGGGASFTAKGGGAVPPAAAKGAAATPAGASREAAAAAADTQGESKGERQAAPSPPPLVAPLAQRLRQSPPPPPPPVAAPSSDAAAETAEAPVAPAVRDGRASASAAASGVRAYAPAPPGSPGEPGGVTAQSRAASPPLAGRLGETLTAPPAGGTAALRSTFGEEGGTASYRELWKSLQADRLPPAGTVRAAEIANQVQLVEMKAADEGFVRPGISAEGALLPKGHNVYLVRFAAQGFRAPPSWVTVEVTFDPATVVRARRVAATAAVNHAAALYEVEIAAHPRQAGGDADPRVGRLQVRSRNVPLRGAEWDLVVHLSELQPTWANASPVLRVSRLAVELGTALASGEDLASRLERLRAEAVELGADRGVLGRSDLPYLIDRAAHLAGAPAPDR